MYMLTNDELINPNNEFEAIVDFIHQQWTNYQYEDLNNIITYIWNKSLNLNNNHFLSYSPCIVLTNWLDERIKNSQWSWIHLSNINKEKLIYQMDAISKTITELSVALIRTERDNQLSELQTHQIINDMLSYIKEQYPNSINIEPNELFSKSSYISSTSVTTTKFQGCDSGSIANGGFNINISPSEIIYAIEQEGKTPLFMLIHAIYEHVAYIQQHNNSIFIKNEIESIKNIYENPIYYQKIQYKFPLELQIQQPILLDIIQKIPKTSLVNNEFEFDNLIKNQINTLNNNKIIKNHSYS